MRAAATEIDRDLSVQIGRIIRTTREDAGWSQRDLAVRLAVAQSRIARLESGRLLELDTKVVSAGFEHLGIRIRFDNSSLGLAGRREQRDGVHASCTAYVTRRLRLDGCLTAAEVEIGTGRTRGWIDVLAHRPDDRAVVVVEIKTEIRDVGAIHRTMGWYERSAWSAARTLGWRPASVSKALLVLDTVENEARVRANEAVLREAFPSRGTAVRDWLLRAGGRPIAGLAMIDPRSRRGDWLRSTRTDGRRTAAAYADNREAAAALRSPRSRRK